MIVKFFKRLFILLLFFPCVTYSSDWITPVSGNWNDPANWSAGVPNSNTAVANFPNLTPTDFTVHLDILPTVNVFSVSNNNHIVFTSSVISFDSSPSNPLFIDQSGLNSYNFIFSLDAPTEFRIFSDTTISTTISGGGSLTKSENGTLTLSGNNNYLGGTIINTGRLRISSEKNLGNGNITFNGISSLIVTASFETIKNISLVSTGIIEVESGVNFTISEEISGPGGLAKIGPGTLILSSINNYNGDTIINGILQISNENNLGNSLNITLDDGILKTSASLNITKSIVLGISGGTLSVDPGTFLDIQNPITAFGIGTLSKIDTGTLTLSSANTYVGSTNINAGTLILSGASNASNSFDIDLGAILRTDTINTISAASSVIDAGTFNLNSFDQSIGSLDGSGSVTLGSAALTTGNDNSSTNFSGGISGSGSLIKEGTGTFTLSNANTYSGATLISAGTLVLSGVSNASNSFDADLGAILRTDAINTISPASSVIADGTFNLNSFDQSIGSLAGSGSVTLGSAALTTGNDNSSSIFTGGISGSGSLIKEGTGTFILSNVNTYSGATSISNGTLVLSGTSNASNSFDVDLGAILRTDAINTISAASSVIADGTFNLNSFDQSIGSLAGSGSITLGSAALTTNNDNSSSIFSGGISGSGSLIKEGTGKFTLSGNNTYTGNTDIHNGNLAVLGTITSPLSNITVAAPALLTGNGTITGNVTNNGRIRPGASIGTLSVIGDVTLNSGSVYQVEFDPTSADLLDVTGIVTIQTDASIELIPDFSIGAHQPFQSYTIIQSGGGVFGKFDNIIITVPAFTVELRYANPNTVDLIVNIVPFSTLVGNGNPSAVAAYFDSLPAQPDNSDLQFVINALRSLSISEMREAFDQLHPAIFKGQALVQENNTIYFKTLINQRIAYLYNPNCLNDCFKCSKTSFWVSPFYDNYIQKNIHDLKGFDSNTGGFAIGADKQICKNNYLGILGGYSLSNLKWNSSRGKSDINCLYLGLYYSWFNKNSFVNTSLAGSFNNFEGKRNIDFAGISRTAKNNHNGKDVNIHLDGGLIFNQCSCFDILPFASADYFYMRENGFTEKEANSLNLEVKKSNYHLLRSEIGTHFNKCFLCNKDLLIDLKLSYIQETRFHGRHYFSNFVYQPGNFVVSGIKYNRNIFSPGLSISKVFSSNNIILSASYNGEFGEKYINNNVSLLLTKSF